MEQTNNLIKIQQPTPLKFLQKLASIFTLLC